MPADRVVATYEIESYLSLERAAEVIANEQSTGTFVAVPRETDEIKARHGATVVDVQELPLGERPPLPGTTRIEDAPLRRGRVQVAFPTANFGPSLPNMLAAVAGNLFELRELAACRLVDLDLPMSFADRYPGPAFGVLGTRAAMSRPDGAMIGTIVKPSIGLTLEELPGLVRELAEAGIDFIKDDELMGNPPHAPLADRVAVVTEELDRVADRLGRKPMYAFNITDDIDQMEANHDLVAEAGGTCVMVCINFVGFAGVAHLRRHATLPIHGHRTMLGALLRDPQLGLGFGAFQKLARLAGVDHLHTNGISNKFFESDEEVLASIRAVRAPMLGGYSTVPVLSSGQWAGLAHRTYELTGTTDLLVLAGGGIHGHPGGSAAGVEAMRAAWSGAEAGKSLEQCAQANPALQQAIDAFGGRHD